MISERIKRNAYLGNAVQYYFWRNYNQQEVDLIEMEEGQIRKHEGQNQRQNVFNKMDVLINTLHYMKMDLSLSQSNNA